MHIFKYSVRKGTKAETMENQVLDEIKEDKLLNEDLKELSFDNLITL